MPEKFGCKKLELVASLLIGVLMKRTVTGKDVPQIFFKPHRALAVNHTSVQIPLKNFVVCYVTNTSTEVRILSATNTTIVGKDALARRLAG
jgi:shikimate 5-dehydrogenase